MISLFRIRHTAAGQERAPQEGRFAAFFLYYGVIDMQRQGILRREAEGIHDGFNFLLLPDLKHQFSGSSQAGIAVEL